MKQFKVSWYQVGIDWQGKISMNSGQETVNEERLQNKLNNLKDLGFKYSVEEVK